MSSPQELVASTWRELGDELTREQSPYLAVHAAAQKDAKLSLLFPFVGVAGFGFSKVVEYPFYVDVLISHVRNDQFSVRATGEGGWAESTRVGEGVAKQCVEMASGMLPDDYGPAIEGDRNAWHLKLGLPPV